tara:strand:- start:568 stop:1368 length:801 start_codon:yes stop_codon:yes gene_type:complete
LKKLLKRKLNEMISKDIITVLQKIDVNHNDVVMIHADAIVAEQYNLNFYEHDMLNYIINILIDFFLPTGTIVVPTYTYSFTTNEIYDVINSPSKIGLFSEKFRKKKGIMRSKNPLFSVATVGRHAKKFENSSFKTSFGKGSCFDVLHKLNGKIICLACNFDRITFTHYVEQKLKVNYRYLKKFLGQIVTNKKRRKITTDFYVRNLGIKSEIYLKSLKNLLLKEKQLKCSTLGRFAVSSVRVRHFEQGIKKIINKNPYGLILEGSKN